MRIKMTLQELLQGIEQKNRRALSKAITLVESARSEDRVLAQSLLEKITISNPSKVIGVTGPPGVGKSTFIEALGMLIAEAKQSVAVLAVDPSSSKTGGSILGDKTRMLELSRDTNAFIRPSPTSGTLGGVTRATRETITLSLIHI